MKPMELRLTRDEYKVFKLEVFRQHIYQMVRRLKFENYREDKREEKRQDREEHLMNRNQANFKKKRKSKKLTTEQNEAAAAAEVDKGLKRTKK